MVCPRAVQRSVHVDDERVGMTAVDPGEGLCDGYHRPPRSDVEIAPDSGARSPASPPSPARDACRCAAPRAGRRARPHPDPLHWAVSGGVGDREPGAVVILHEVEPVAADLVGRHEAARELAPRDPRDSGREEVLLDLGSGRCRLPPPRGLDQIGVVVRELERSRALLRDVLERCDGRADAEEQRRDPAPQPERLERAPRQRHASCAESRRALRGRSRARARAARPGDRGSRRSRRAGSAGSRRCRPVQADGHPTGATRLGDELVGDEVRRHLVQHVGHLQGQAVTPQTARCDVGSVVSCPVGVRIGRRSLIPPFKRLVQRRPAGECR